jgi:hypothetical protein
MSVVGVANTTRLFMPSSINRISVYRGQYIGVISGSEYFFITAVNKIVL